VKTTFTRRILNRMMLICRLLLSPPLPAPPAGDKIGLAESIPTLVGPGCETPGATNCGLAEEIKKILAVRPMPVFAQWEIADALVHGAGGAPEGMTESFGSWEMADALEGGDVSKVNYKIHGFDSPTVRQSDATKSDSLMPQADDIVEPWVSEFRERAEDKSAVDSLPSIACSEAARRGSRLQNWR
jgi:hypothetical protein